MPCPCAYKVYARPRGGPRKMIAKFYLFADGVQYAINKSTADGYFGQTITVTFADGKVAAKFVRGVRQ